MTARETLEKTFEDLRKHEEEKRKEYGEAGWQTMSNPYWWDSIYRRSLSVKNKLEYKDYIETGTGKREIQKELLKIILESCFLYQRMENKSLK